MPVRAILKKIFRKKSDKVDDDDMPKRKAESAVVEEMPKPKKTIVTATDGESSPLLHCTALHMVVVVVGCTRRNRWLPDCQPEPGGECTSPGSAESLEVQRSHLPKQHQLLAHVATAIAS